MNIRVCETLRIWNCSRTKKMRERRENIRERRCKMNEEGEIAYEMEKSIIVNYRLFYGCRNLFRGDSSSGSRGCPGGQYESGLCRSVAQF